MTSRRTLPPITAIVYPEGQHVDDLMRAIADRLRADGVRLAGAVQINQTRPWRPKCDMTLVDLSSGREVRISEDRGPEARGCRLDVAALDQAMVMTAAGLAAGADLLIVNKFGKMEAAGRGGRLDVAALDQAMVMTAAGLAAGADLLIVNKFGKMEAAGRGFGPLIGEAIADGVPVLIAVPEANVAAWDAFAGDYSAQHDLADLGGPIGEVCTRLALAGRT